LSRKNSLSIRFMVIFLLLGVIPVALAGGISYYIASDSIREEVYSGLGVYGEDASRGLEDFFEERAYDARVFSNHHSIYEGLTAGRSY